MTQKTIDSFFTIREEQGKLEERKIQDSMLYIVPRADLKNSLSQCPTCSHDLLSMPETIPYEFRKIDPTLRKFRFINICVQCPKLIVTPRTFGDIWIDIFSECTIPTQLKDQRIAKQEQLKEQKEADGGSIQCPKCKRPINLQQISPSDRAFIKKGVVLPCPFCKQLLLLSHEKFNRITQGGS
jgi:uncharacterized protein with PIN domain